jgi:hypothetical protein
MAPIDGALPAIHASTEKFQRTGVIAFSFLQWIGC